MIDVSSHREASSPDRAQRATVGALMALAAVGWVATSRLMAGMDAGPGTDPGSLGFYSGTWAVMMAAMMLPSLGPAAIAYGNVRRAHARSGIAGSATAGSATAGGGSGAVDPSAAVFVLGYLALWALAGLAAYTILEAGRSLDGGFFAWARAGRWAAAGVLALAAVYELTPRKRGKERGSAP